MCVLLDPLRQSEQGHGCCRCGGGGPAGGLHRRACLSSVLTQTSEAAHQIATQEEHNLLPAQLNEHAWWSVGPPPPMLKRQFGAELRIFLLIDESNLLKFSHCETDGKLFLQDPQGLNVFSTVASLCGYQQPLETGYSIGSASNIFTNF